MTMENQLKETQSQLTKTEEQRNELENRSLGYLLDIRGLEEACETLRH